MLFSHLHPSINVAVTYTFVTSLGVLFRCQPRYLLCCLYSCSTAPCCHLVAATFSTVAPQSHESPRGCSYHGNYSRLPITYVHRLSSGGAHDLQTPRSVYVAGFASGTSPYRRTLHQNGGLTPDRRTPHAAQPRSSSCSANC